MPTASEKNAARKPRSTRARSTAKAAPPSSLTEAIAKVQKDFGLDIGEPPEVDRISTGNVALDYVMGGGLPKGRIVEIYGLQSSGKTTAALQAAAREQKDGRRILYLDYEQALDPEYCEALGLDIRDHETFIQAQPDTFEQGMNGLRALVQTGEISLCIVDSVAQMVTEKELEMATGSQSNFGEKARMMAQVMRQLAPVLRQHGVCVVFLNHVRDVIDTSPMGQRLSSAGVERKTTPGGGALKFAASVRLHFKVKQKINADRYEPLANESVRTPIGAHVEVKCEKNKVGTPWRSADLYQRYGHGFSAGWTALQVLISHGQIKKKAGGIYEFSDEAAFGDNPKTIKGEDAALLAIESDREWVDHLSALAAKALEEEETVLLAASDETGEVPVSENGGASLDDLDALLKAPAESEPV